MRKGVGAKVIREKMQTYVNSLKTEFSNGLILPAKDAAPPPKAAPAVITKSQTTAKTADQMKNLDLGCKISIGSLELEEAFKCTGMPFKKRFSLKNHVVCTWDNICLCQKVLQ